jgi:uncharacterized membrane protein HdeD (DUF308 family)
MGNQSTSGIILKLIYFKGFALLLTGLILVIFPEATITTLTVVLGVYWLFDGISTTSKSLKERKYHKAWKFGLFTGILGIVAGLLILSQPLLGSVFAAIYMMMFLGFISILYGISNLITGIQLHKNASGKTAMILGGLFSILLGAVLVTSPYISAVTIVYSIGIIAIFGGLIILMVAYTINKQLKA